MAEPSRKKIKTRSSGDYFLIGRSTPHISGNKLPLLKQVLQHVLHLKESLSSTTPLKNHFSAAIDEVSLIWSKAGIQTMPKRNVLRRLQKEYNTWLQLCKNKLRLSDPGRKREMFEEDLSKLWDIGASDAVQIIQKNKMSAEKKIEDIAFYDDQRNARNSIVSGKDVMLQKSLQKRQERKARLIISGQSSSDEIDSDVFKQSSSTVSTPSSASECEQSEKAGPSSQNSFVTLSVPGNLINSSEITEVFGQV